MSIANNEIQIQWSGANSVSVSAAGNQTSDVFNFSGTAIDAMITLKADNAGTPASGDTVELHLLATCGDPDGAGSDEFPLNDNDGILLAVLDTYANDPAIKTVACPIAKGGKLFAKNASSGRAITVSACVNEKIVSSN
jgi:hypothetical protein